MDSPKNEKKYFLVEGSNDDERKGQKSMTEKELLRYLADKLNCLIIENQMR